MDVSKSEKVTKMGVDPSLGKDNELFGVGTKNVVPLENELAPSKLGKTTVSLFLEQINDVTTYPCRSSNKTSESLGDILETVTDMNNADQGRRVELEILNGKTNIVIL